MFSGLDSIFADKEYQPMLALQVYLPQQVFHSILGE
jgi:hypothetical protein